MRPEIPKFRQFEEAFKRAIKEKKAEQGESTENPETAKEVMKDLKEMGIIKEELSKETKGELLEKKELGQKIQNVIDELNNLTDEFEGLNEHDSEFLTEEEKEKFLKTNAKWEPLISEFLEGKFDETMLKELKDIRSELKGILTSAYKRYSKISPAEPKQKETKNLKSQIEEGWNWLSQKKKLKRKIKKYGQSI